QILNTQECPTLAAHFGPTLGLYSSGDCDFRIQINILDGVEQFHAFRHGALEGLPAGDEAHASGALVDHCGAHGFAKVVGSRSAAAVDQAGASHVAVGHLVAA